MPAQWVIDQRTRPSVPTDPWFAVDESYRNSSRAAAEYKGHKIFIEEERDDDCIKNYHVVVCPNGHVRHADITPYDPSVEVVQLWIDAGYPGYAEFGNYGNWDKVSLRRLIARRNPQREGAD